MKFHLLHVRIARSYGFPRYVILASFHSIRTDFVSLVIFISQRNLVSFRQFYTKSKDRSTAAVTRAQNTLQRVILFRNLHRRNYFSRAIRREKNKEKKLKIDHRSLRLRERLTEFSTRRTLFEFYPRRYSHVLETSKQRLVCNYVLANVAQTFDIGRFERVIRGSSVDSLGERRLVSIAKFLLFPFLERRERARRTGWRRKLVGVNTLSSANTRPAPRLRADSKLEETAAFSGLHREMNRGGGYISARRREDSQAFGELSRANDPPLCAPTSNHRLLMSRRCYDSYCTPVLSGVKCTGGSTNQ